jgi:hypothetical protein
MWPEKKNWKYLIEDRQKESGRSEEKGKSFVSNCK